MSRAVGLFRRLALLSTLWASVSLANAGPASDVDFAAREAGEAGLELRLADGSVLRVPFLAAGKLDSSRSKHTTSAPPATDAWRKGPPQPDKVLDFDTHAVIASVRG